MSPVSLPSILLVDVFLRDTRCYTTVGSFSRFPMKRLFEGPRTTTRRRTRTIAKRFHMSPLYVDGAGVFVRRKELVLELGPVAAWVRSFEFEKSAAASAAADAGRAARLKRLCATSVFCSS